MTLFILPAGGFFVLGCVIALVNKISNREPKKVTGCAACGGCEACGGCPSGEADKKEEK